MKIQCKCPFRAKCQWHFPPGANFQLPDLSWTSSEHADFHQEINQKFQGIQGVLSGNKLLKE